MMRTCLSRPAAPAALVLCVLVAAGCASIVTPPVDVTLARVELADFAVLEQRLNLSLRFVNRGDHDVAVDGLDFTLDINGLPFAGGVSAQAFSIPRYGETTVQVIAVSNLSAVLRQLSEVNGRLGGATAIPAALSYRIHGRANAGLFGLAFDTQSELPFPIAPG
jgi:hypothetical protein